MTYLIRPQDGDGPRVSPLQPDDASPLIRAEYDKAKHTWGIPNHLVYTMGCHPRLALTEVDYANAFIFDEGEYFQIPRPGAPGGAGRETVLFPVAGFIDRVTKELVISVVSLLNRSRYSITHHTGIAFATLSALVEGDTPEARARRAEEMLLQLVDGDGQVAFRGATFEGAPLYSDLHLSALELALKMNGDPHEVTDAEMARLRGLLKQEARSAIAASPAAQQFGAAGPDDAYVVAWVDAMMVELTWCIAHFGGLLNRWFIVMKMHDEDFDLGAGQTFFDNYNAGVPKSIKERNNALLAPDGFGGNA